VRRPSSRHSCRCGRHHQEHQHRSGQDAESPERDPSLVHLGPPVADLHRNFHFDFAVDEQYNPYCFSMQWPAGFSEFGESRVAPTAVQISERPCRFLRLRSPRRQGLCPSGSVGTTFSSSAPPGRLCLPGGAEEVGWRSPATERRSLCRHGDRSRKLPFRQQIAIWTGLDRAKLLRLDDYDKIRRLRRQVVLQPQYLVAGGGELKAEARSILERRPYQCGRVHPATFRARRRAPSPGFSVLGFGLAVGNRQSLAPAVPVASKIRSSMVSCGWSVSFP
jgi:hypothetical protein